MSAPPPAGPPAAPATPIFNPLVGPSLSESDFEAAAWRDFTYLVGGDARDFARAAWDTAKNSLHRKIEPRDVEEARKLHTPGRIPTFRTYLARICIAVTLMIAVAAFERGYGEWRAAKVVAPDLVAGFLIGATAIVLQITGKHE